MSKSLIQIGDTVDSGQKLYFSWITPTTGEFIDGGDPGLYKSDSYNIITWTNGNIHNNREHTLLARKETIILTIGSTNTTLAVREGGDEWKSTTSEITISNNLGSVTYVKDQSNFYNKGGQKRIQIDIPNLYLGNKQIRKIEYYDNNNNRKNISNLYFYDSNGTQRNIFPKG